MSKSSGCKYFWSKSRRLHTNHHHELSDAVQRVAEVVSESKLPFELLLLLSLENWILRNTITRKLLAIAIWQSRIFKLVDNKKFKISLAFVK